MHAVGRVRRAVLRWPAERHALAAELAVVLGLYALYETTRGLVAGDRAGAVDHARTIASLERALHVFAEPHVQAAARDVPGLIGTLGALYLTLHLTVTGVYLLWLHRRRPGAYPVVRNALLLASGLALIGFLAFPTAPPRLAGVGIADTISHGHVDLNHGLVSALYNPFAAVPSMHIGYAAIVGAGLWLYGGRRLLRILAVVYPALQLLVIVATGNHFFFDAATGAAVAAVAFPLALAARVRLPAPPRRLSAVGRSPVAPRHARPVAYDGEESGMSVLASAAPAVEHDRRRWIALAVIVTAQFMVVLDVAIVNVALPTIKTDLHFSQESLQWVVTAYSILFGGVLLLGGRMADLLGRRRLFMAGLALFTVSSLLDGLAWSEGSLIAFRSAQGLGAALLSPAALSILTTTFAEGRDRNLALGIWGAVSGSGGAAGVLLGGALTSALSWSWIFFINVPVGVAVFALAPRLVRESRAEVAHRHFDVPGAASITGGLMLLVYAMTRAVQHGWGTGETIGLLAASGALVVAFVAIEARSAAPLLPLRMFRLRTLTGSNLAGLLMGGAVFSQFFLLTLYMQQVLHYSALQTGVAYVALTLTIIVFANVSQALALRVGIRRLLPLGLLMTAGGIVLYAQLPVHGHYFWDLFPAFMLSGLGMAFAFVPMTIGALAGVRNADAGIASGLINTSQQIGGAIGVAAVTTIAATYTGRYVDSHAGASAFGGPALTHGFEIAFYVLAAIAVAGAVLAALIVESKPRLAEDAESPIGEPLLQAAA
ncbi:MAG TPA: DHA2 family efflux MFS transporter permease subunit [Gaiellaceae bacterium]|nr:DHA2 family efflux MFS transporter permease subunit [Gaiellaceae bacterium]